MFLLWNTLFYLRIVFYVRKRGSAASRFESIQPEAVPDAVHLGGLDMVSWAAWKTRKSWQHSTKILGRGMSVFSTDLQSPRPGEKPGESSSTK